jgi:hypothetical protein
MVVVKQSIQEVAIEHAWRFWARMKVGLEHYINFGEPQHDGRR